jgi:hypothetical protein
MAATNPLLEATLDFLHQGKQFAAISPGEFGDSERAVTFRFSDGTEETRTFQCDHSTFMEWWKRTSGYLRHARSAADAFSSELDA